jgi:hypothetical protein
MILTTTVIRSRLLLSTFGSCVFPDLFVEWQTWLVFLFGVIGVACLLVWSELAG